MDKCDLCGAPLFEYDDGVTRHVRSQTVECADEPSEPALLVELPDLPSDADA